MVQLAVTIAASLALAVSFSAWVSLSAFFDGVRPVSEQVE